MEGHNDFAMADTFGVVEDFAFEAEQRRYQNMPVTPSPYLQTPLPNPMAGVPGREFRLGSHFLLQPDFPNFVCRLALIALNSVGLIATPSMGNVMGQMLIHVNTTCNKDI